MCLFLLLFFDTMNQHVLTIGSTGSSNYRDHMQLLVTSVGDECRDLVRPSSAFSSAEFIIQWNNNGTTYDNYVFIHWNII